MAKAVETKIADMIVGQVEALGYDLVRALISGGGKYAKLQVMAERKDGVGMTVEDCATISKAVSEIVEADPDLAERFELEVSSPGIDRPLVKIADYERFKGHVAKVDLTGMINGRRKIQGKIAGVAGEEIEFDIDNALFKVSFKDIERAKLVLTDALMKESLATGRR